MEPRAHSLSDLALRDPIAAYGVLSGVPQIPISMNCQAKFSSFDTQQIPVVAPLDTTIAQRTWVDQVNFDVQVPNLFNGNVFKTQFDANLRQAPGVSIQIIVLGGPRYVVSPEFTPINDFVHYFAARWPAGWQLFKQQSIKTSFMLTQPPGGAGVNAPPYTVTLTFSGWQFEDHRIDEVSRDFAIDQLRKAGFAVPPQ